MKTPNHIGTKAVKAGPANRKDGGEEGYKAVYGGGYESRSPEDVSEKAYGTADTPLDRMYIERDELADRLGRLSRFLDREDAIRIVGERQLKLMEWQEIHMHDYLKALDDRIALAENRI